MKRPYVHYRGSLECCVQLSPTQGTAHDLYWSNGDSGPQEDTDEHGQNLDDIHATIVRITVPTTGTGYTIPSGNVEGGTRLIRGSNRDLSGRYISFTRVRYFSRTRL